MPKRSNYHIVPSPEKGWIVRKEGAKKISDSAATQRGAEKRAKELASKNGGGEVVIHRRDGKIRDKDTIFPASDPLPPRDKRY
jgi:hypothetical protein